MFMCCECVPAPYPENTRWARGVASTGKVTSLGSSLSLGSTRRTVWCNRRRKPRDRFDCPFSLSLLLLQTLPPQSPEYAISLFRIPRALSTMSSSPAECDSSPTPSRQTYKVYKRRFWGLAQLVLLNIVVSWDVRPHPGFPHCYNHVLTTT